MDASDHALSEMLERAHLAAGHDLPAIARQFVPAFGGIDVVCYLVDLQQSVLIPFLDAGQSASSSPELLSVESTLAGRAFQHVQVLLQRRPRADPLLWLPMLDGTERIGVLAVSIPDSADLPDHGAVVGDQALRLRGFASLLAELITTKTMYGDSIVRLRRTAEMQLAAEIQWSLLPPLTFACPQVTVAATLEPAYEIAGDTIDYAVDQGMARVAVFDGMGHGLVSAQLAAMTVAAYRNARRRGSPLINTGEQLDAVLQETFGSNAFVTAVLVELDTESGTLRWLNAGHPEPLLLRHGRLVKKLHSPPRPPFGVLMGDSAVERPTVTGLEQLEPGDCVLLYTDGVTEARSPDGEFFGEQRLTDLIVRNLAARLPLPETMRRVVRALLEHQAGRLTDDATLAILQWPTDVDALLP